MHAEGGFSDLSRRAALLRSLHHGDRPLLLANAWDVASARAFEGAGLPAVATSSSAVAAVLGHRDGEDTSADEMLAAVSRIAAGVSVPVTADLEGGYGLGPEELAARAVGAGLAGLNLEDSDHRAGGLVDVDLQVERISALRRALDAAGAELVINARVDVHLRRIGSPRQQLEAALDRGRRYLSAGADCVYPITVSDEETITALVGGLRGPVNILFTRSTPTLARLAELGVARISFGGGLFRLAHEVTVRAAARLAAGDDPFNLEAPGR